jgi:hypothetical protein
MTRLLTSLRKSASNRGNVVVETRGTTPCNHGSGLFVRWTAVLAFAAIAISGSVPAKTASAALVDINGGSSWGGWTLKGISNLGSTQSTNPPGIYGSGDLSQYNVYSTVFLFDSAVNFKTGTTTGSQEGAGSTGFGSSGTGANKAFANGNKILGIGVEVLSGTLPVRNTLRLDNAGDSYLAATTTTSGNGKASFSQNSNQGDWTVQFTTSNWTAYTVNSQAGNPGGPVSTPNDTRSIGNTQFQNYDNLPFRAFGAGTGPTFSSYQMFIDLDAAYQLFGTPNGYGATIGPSGWFPIGQPGSNMSFSLNGVGSNNAAFGVAIVPIPEPSSQVLAVLSLLTLSAGSLVTRRMRKRLAAAG